MEKFEEDERISKILAEKFGITEKRLELLRDIGNKVSSGDFMNELDEEGKSKEEVISDNGEIKDSIISSDVVLGWILDQDLTKEELALLAITSISIHTQMISTLYQLGPVGQMIAKQIQGF